MFFCGGVLWLIGLADIVATAYGISYDSDLFSEWNPLLVWFFERWGLMGLVVSKMIHHTLLVVAICFGARYEIARNKLTPPRARMYFWMAVSIYLGIAVPSYILLLYYAKYF